MTPDLGKYASTVLSAWTVTLVLLAGLVGLSLWRSRQVRRALEAQERKAARNG